MGNIDGTTAAFRYALLLTDYMWERSTEVRAYTLAEYGFPVENPQEKALIYKGNVRTEASEIGLSQSTSNDGMAVLNAMHCISLLKAGGPKTKSVYLLHFRLTLEAYEQFRERQGSLNRRIKPSKWDQMLNDMAKMKIDLREMSEKIVYLEGLVVGLHSKIHGDGV